jgi:hypothetical protein
VQVNGPQTATGEVRADVREKAQAQQWTESLEWCFYKGFEYAAEWLGQKLPEGFSLTLFRDFAILSPGAAQDLAMLQMDVRERRLTRATYLRELKRRGKLHSDWDPELEEEALAEEDASSEQARMDALAAQLKAEEERAAQDAAKGDKPAEDGAADGKEGEGEEGDDAEEAA